MLGMNRNSGGTMNSEGISQSEFDIVDFLRDLFPRVTFGIPKLGRDEANWKLTYVALYGLNEIARHFDDRIDLEIDTFEDKVFYQIHTRSERLRPIYREIIDIVEDGDIEDIIERSVLPCADGRTDINHNQNFEAIDMLLAFDANDPGGLPDELLDAEDMILFGSKSEDVIKETEQYLYHLSMSNGLRCGEVIRPHRGIEISKLTTA
jgi:hypothetical protein